MIDLDDVSDLAVRGLAARLRVAARLLDVDVALESEVPSTDASLLLAALLRTATRSLDPATIWLLFTAVTASFPGTEQMQQSLRQFELLGADEAEFWILDAWYPYLFNNPAAALPMEIVTDAVVLDVSHTSRHDLHTGIQRVVRCASPYWAECGPVTAVAWIDGWRAYRTLSDAEQRRVFAWDQHQTAPSGPSPSGPSPGDRAAVVVPWRSTILLAEALEAGSCDKLVALARWSGSELASIGYDLIPAVSADKVPVALSDQFMKYLTVIKHTSRVAGISASAAAEFRGYTEMLANQGLPGPEVSVCELPAPPMPADPVEIPEGRTRVVMVGSFEPRKNHLALLFAAERLWREGLDFELHLVGGMSWVHDIHDEIDRLASLGRPVHKHHAVSEAELDRQYQLARFSVFLSVHEGYGLPVVESLAAGTPALVSDLGSVGEIAAAGGCTTVDPRDDDAICDAMRRMLLDDALIERLQTEIAARTTTTWHDYARASWKAVTGVEPGQPLTGRTLGRAEKLLTDRVPSGRS